MTDDDSKQPQQSNEMDAENIPGTLIQNVETIHVMDSEDAHHLHPLQKFMESIGRSLEHPLFVALIALFVAIWILLNLFGTKIGFTSFDHPPFPWLQGVMSTASFIAMTLVLVKQNRKTEQDRRRDHLQLQLIMLTEQKVAKLIGLIGELRRDLPTIDDRHDPEAETLKKATHPQTVLDALEGKLDAAKERKRRRA